MLKEGAGADREVDVAVRPEGFVMVEAGDDAEQKHILECNLKAVEVSGRDVSIVSTHPANQGVNIRSIMGSDRNMKIEGETVRFKLKPSKVYLFDKESGKRL